MKVKPTLIGITGKARSGKDTIAAYMATKYGIERYAFASPIKAGVRTMFGLNGRHTDGDLKEIPLPEFGNKSPREMMQTLGTEWGRELVNCSIWVDLGLYEWNRLKAAGKSLAITDVRFENEADAIRNAGGTIIHVRRPMAPGVSYHSSEAGVLAKGSDIIIDNDRELVDLFEAIDFDVMPLLFPGGYHYEATADNFPSDFADKWADSWIGRVEE